MFKKLIILVVLVTVELPMFVVPISLLRRFYVKF